MIKRISAILCLVILLFLVSCGKPKDTTDAMYQIGCNTLNITDEYLNGKITGEEAQKRLDEFVDQANAQFEQDCKDTNKDTLIGTNMSNDYFIHFDITFLSYAISDACDGSGPISDVQEKRDDLAEDLGNKRQYGAKKEIEAITTNYSYETTSNIEESLNSSLKKWNFDIFVFDTDGTLDISIDRKTLVDGAICEYCSALPEIKEAVLNVTNEYNISEYDFRFTYLLYSDAITEDADDIAFTMSFSTSDFEICRCFITSHSEVLLGESGLSFERSIEQINAQENKIN